MIFLLLFDSFYKGFDGYPISVLRVDFRGFTTYKAFPSMIDDLSSFAGCDKTDAPITEMDFASECTAYELKTENVITI